MYPNFTQGGSSGSRSSPPLSRIHCTLYVFRMCEKTWRTSPAGLIFVMRNLSWPLSVFAFDFEASIGGCSSISFNLASPMLFMAVGESESLTSGRVGNSCNPASKPDMRVLRRYTTAIGDDYGVPCSGRRTRRKCLAPSGLHHSTTLTASISSLAFLLSTFIGYLITPTSSFKFTSSHSAQSSSIS